MSYVPIASQLPILFWLADLVLVSCAYQVLERRAREVRKADVLRFIADLRRLNWSPTSLVFLDEVSFDSRDMRRRYGYSPRGQKLVIRGDAGRSQRISLLCFQGVDGLLEAYITEGTFTRQVFFEKLRDFALSGVISPCLASSRLPQAPAAFGSWMGHASTATLPSSTTCALSTLKCVGKLYIFLCVHQPHPLNHSP